MRIRRLTGALALLVACGLGSTQAVAQEGADPLAAVDYSDHAIVLVDVTDRDMLSKLQQEGITLTCRAQFGPQPVVVKRGMLEELDDDGVAYQMLEADAQAWMERDRTERAARKAQRGIGFYDAYRTYDEISNRSDALVAANPGIATRISLGTSLGDQPLGLPGLDIFSIRVTGPSMPGDPEKPVVVINGCQHAREWLSPHATLYTAEMFMAGYGSDPRITSIVDAVELHFIPVVNPNGYEYTHNVDRFWRKNRRQNPNGTQGVDLNRNWPVGYNNGQSTSTSGGSQVYVGTAPLSEPEASLLATFLADLAGTVECLDGCGSGCCGIGESTSRLKGHIDVHTYAQVILGPWSYTSATLPPRPDELNLVQDAMSDAMLAATGAFYPAALGDEVLLYPAGGVMPDYTFGELGALSWTFEMRPSGNLGLSGFAPPPDQIDDAGEELFAATLELAEHAAKRLGITLESPVPVSAAAETAFGVDVKILEFNGYTLSPGSALLRSRTGASGMFDMEPLSGAGDTYTATITAPACGETVQYFFEAMATDGTIVTLPDDGTFFETTGAEVVTAFDDDFEIDRGWIVNELGTDTATTGIWERVAPNATAAQSGSDYSPDGTMCYVTDGAGGSLGAADVDDGDTTLTSPFFDLAGSTGATVRYARWYSNDTGAAPNSDIFLVEISDNGGATWTTLETVGPAGPGTSGGWFEVEYRIEDFVSLTDSVRVRFTASDFGSGSIVEAMVDEFVIEADEECPVVNTCIADFDSDGDVDLTDFGVFGAAFGSTPGDPNWDPQSDLDDDGDVDLTDFGIFGSEFGRTDCLP